LRLSGLVLLVVGLFFLAIAHIQLGNSFSIGPEARRLVTQGLYSKIRNPIERKPVLLEEKFGDEYRAKTWF